MLRAIAFSRQGRVPSPARHPPVASLRRVALHAIVELAALAGRIFGQGRRRRKGLVGGRRRLERHRRTGRSRTAQCRVVGLVAALALDGRRRCRGRGRVGRSRGRRRRIGGWGAGAVPRRRAGRDGVASAGGAASAGGGCMGVACGSVGAGAGAFWASAGLATANAARMRIFMLRLLKNERGCQTARLAQRTGRPKAPLFRRRFNQDRPWVRRPNRARSRRNGPYG